MKNLAKKISAVVLVLAMVCTTFLSYMPSLDVLAAPITKQMAHLKSGSGNGNGHFGSTEPEAFVLSEKNTYTNEDFSFTLKLGSIKEDTRLRFVNKYVDDTHWSYLAYDGASGWFVEYKNGANSSWVNLSGLPTVEQNDVIEVSGSYETDGLHIAVENTTTGAKGTAVANNADFLGLKSQAGKVGFGSATYVSQSKYTDIYFADVVVGTEELAGSAFSPLNADAAGQVWEESVPVVVGDDGETDPTEPTGGRKWIVLTGGSNNGNGHAYGNANTAAPILLLDNTNRMEVGKEISLSVKPSVNWGVFYTYVDDNNWLYVGYDSSSKWYYQYNINGSGTYAGIGGLPAPVEGEELSMSLSLDRETLSVTVNGKTVRVPKDALIGLAEKDGRFGVKTNGQTSISFADVTYDGTNCMEDTWVFCAERAGQTFRIVETELVAVTGKVKNAAGAAISGATVRLGSKSTVTDTNGNYQFDAVEVGTYNMAVTKAGYEAFEAQKEVVSGDNVFADVVLSEKAALDLSQYDTIQSDVMKVYIGKEFPVVARYEMLAGDKPFFRGNETDLKEVVINGVTIQPTVTAGAKTTTSKEYVLAVKKDAIDLTMKVKVSVDDNDLTWQVTELTKNTGCPAIATIDIPQLNLVSVDAAETESVFAGAQASTTTTKKADTYITFDDGFVPSNSDGYLYAFLSNGKLSAGLHSNSEVEGDKRVERNNGADTMSLTSAVWYYERGDRKGQARTDLQFPTSELPYAKVAIAGDLNEDGDIDWNDGALAYRDIMNIPYGSDVIKDMVNYRIVMNFASMAPNPYLTTADNIKKVYLATDGLPQAVMLKGYGNEGHDSANSEYADIAEREGGVKDFQNLIKIAHDYNTEIGVHVNAQEVYPEAKSFCEEMLEKPYANGWGWLDQSHVIDKHWDLSTQARYKRFVQFYDRINGTKHYSGDWEKGEYVGNSQGTLDITSREVMQAEAESKPDNMDFIYLDVWYQDSWETRQIANEINSLGWRFSTEFSGTGEYNSTWQHWSTDAGYGGATSKGFNSDIIRFIRNDQRDSQVLNHPEFGGTADNPLLGGYRLYGFEGWGGDRSYNNYIEQTFNENLPTKFLQHYIVTDWENYAEGESPVGNTEKKITLKNEAGDVVVVTRNEEQRSDRFIERTIKLNDKVVLNDMKYLLPWTDNQNGEVKLYHWNYEGGSSEWTLPNGWENLANVVVYELSDQGRINETTIPVTGGKVTLDAKAKTAYIVVKGSAIKTLKNDFGQADYVVDPGFNGYAAGTQLDSADWTGDILDPSVVVEKANTGDQRLAFNSPADDVAVTTEIKGLTAGKDYVAEVYVQNDSDAKATITVDAGKKTVSNYVERSILQNYVKCDQKNGSKMQRMQVSFVAEGTSAEVTLSRAAGEGSTYMDDIRIVEKKLNNFQADGSFKQDFETVVQGLYPFVLSSAQGISDPVTHLSQLHEPYSQAGWNNRVIDDVIDGDWSLKHHGANTGIIYQTLPQNFRFEAGKVYTVEFDYQSGPDKAYAMVIGDGMNYTMPGATDYLAAAHGAEATEHVTMQVIGSGSGQTWIGLFENGSRAGNGSMGQTDFTLDNLVIRENKDADVVVVSISNKDLYKGETADIFGNKLDLITWTSSDESVAVVDKEAGIVKALKAGTATLTASYGEGETTFEITVSDGIAADMPREEFEDISGSANTEETSGENGRGINVADGDSNTIWHSQYNGGRFTVSEDNPAVLTVDLGGSMEIGGFKFQQRPNVNNGIVWQYRYEILDEAGSVIAEGDSVTTSAGERQASAWVTSIFAGTVNAKTVKIYVEEGQGGFAAIAEVEPIAVQKTTEEATLDNATVGVGEKVVLEPKHAANTVLKGLVWSSSDETVATVNQNGTVTGVKAGTTVITITNAAGLRATCTVTVTGESTIDYTALNKAIADAKKVVLAECKDGAEKDAFVKALRDAEALVGNAKTQAEADNMATVLGNAQKALKPVDVPVEVDRTKLEAAINKADEIELDKYPNGAAKDAFVKALQAAKDAYANASTQSAVDNAMKALETAQKALEDSTVEEPSKVDKSKLEKYYSECAAYYKEADYTKATWKNYAAALENAKTVLANRDATQQDVNSALDALIKAAKELKRVEGAKPSPDEPKAPTTGDMASWAWMMALLVLAAGTIVVIRRRKRA